MERKVYLTKLRPEYREEYLQAHRTVSQELLRRYKAAGMRHCAVYLLEDTLVLITESEDHITMTAALAGDPVDVEWQNYVRPMKAEGDWRETVELFRADL